MGACSQVDRAFDSKSRGLGFTSHHSLVITIYYFLFHQVPTTARETVTAWNDKFVQYPYTWPAVKIRALDLLILNPLCYPFGHMLSRPISNTCYTYWPHICKQEHEVYLYIRSHSATWCKTLLVIVVIVTSTDQWDSQLVRLWPFAKVQRTWEKMPVFNDTYSPEETKLTKCAAWFFILHMLKFKQVPSASKFGSSKANLLCLPYNEQVKSKDLRVPKSLYQAQLVVEHRLHQIITIYVIKTSQQLFMIILCSSNIFWNHTNKDKDLFIGRVLNEELLHANVRSYFVLYLLTQLFHIANISIYFTKVFLQSFFWCLCA